MTKALCLLLAGCLCLACLIPAASLAADQRWQGSIQGLKCVTQGKVCPINMEDPLIALEKTFVLLLPDGTWYYLPNLDRAMLARHINRPVAVEGILEKGSRAIHVSKFFVRRGDAWREAWSPDLERRLLMDLQGWGQAPQK